MERKEGREAYRDVSRKPLLELARCSGQGSHESLLTTLVIRQTRNVNLRQPCIVRHLNASHGQESQVGVVHHDQLALDATPYERFKPQSTDCLLYTSDAADDLLCVDLGGRRIIKKKK